MWRLHRSPPLIAALLLGQAVAQLVPGAGNAAVVYRCVTPDGATAFTQFPCGDSTRVTLQPTRTVRLPPLSAQEEQVLDTLARQHAAEVERRERARARASERARARGEQRRSRCQAARQARVALATQRRKGYSLGEARRLDAREQALAAEERDNC